MSKLDEIFEQNWKADGTFDDSLKPQIKAVFIELIDEAEKEWGSPKYTKLREKVEEL